MRARSTAWIVTGVLALVAVALIPGAVLSLLPAHAGSAASSARVTVAPPSAGPVASGAPRAHLPLRKHGDDWVVPDAKPKKLTAKVAGRYIGRLRDDTVRLLRRVSPGLRTHPGPTTPSEDDDFCDPGKKSPTDTVSAAVPHARPDALPWALWDSWRAVPGVEPEFGDGHDTHITLNSRGAPAEGSAGIYQVRVTQANGNVTITVTGPCL